MSISLEPRPGIETVAPLHVPTLIEGFKTAPQRGFQRTISMYDRISCVFAELGKYRIAIRYLRILDISTIRRHE